MRKIISTILLVFAVSFGAPVESAKNTIFVLMGTENGVASSSSSIWETTDLEKYVRNNIVGNNSFLYSAAYNLAESTPAVFANEKFAAQDAAKSIQKKALQDWFNSNTDSKIKSFGSLEKLQKARPDLVPSKFVVVAEGAAGLAAREYIQGANYVGDIANVLFFNTPHEGTGFADQALFNDYADLLDKPSSSSLEALIPMILAAYLFDEAGMIQDLLMGLGKDVVMSMAYNKGNIAKSFRESKLFESANNLKNNALWYLTQDADITDPSYTKLLEKGGIDKSVVDTLVGSTQLLNSLPKKTDFKHPNYNLVYSFGLPSIGNGRRTLDDFMDQNKIHISEKQIKKQIKENLKNSLEPYKDQLDAYKEQLEETLNNYVDQIVDNQFVSDLGDFAKDLVNQYDALKDKVDAIQQTMKDYNVAGYIEGISKLRNYEFNKDDVVGSVLKLIAIVEKFIPEKYKSEIYSVFMDEISPIAKEVSQITGTIKEGMKVVSSSLSSYSLNFFDEGTFDVPSYSAMANNVAAFKEAGANRLKVDLSSALESNLGTTYSDLKGYKNKIDDIGKLEDNRKIVDVGLALACVAANIATPAAKEACKAAKFATNIALISEMSSKIKDVVDAAGHLKDTKKIALAQSIISNIKTIPRISNSSKEDVFVSQLDDMLFEPPFVTIAGVQKDDGSVIPLLLSSECNNEILDFASLEACGVLYADVLPKSAKSFSDISLLNESVPVSIGSSYMAFSNQDIKNHINEYRFKIVDLQPDSLWLIKIDFNTRIQMLFERIDKKTWKQYYGIDNKYIDLGILSEHPVRADGLFIFRPGKVMEKYNSFHMGSYANISAIQEDGANVVSFYTVDKIGKSRNQHFTFKYEAAEVLMEEGWPTMDATVSGFTKINAYYNDKGYAKKLEKAGVRIARIADNVVYADTIEVPIQLLENNESRRWVAGIDLSSVTLDNEIVEGEYVLTWDFLLRDEDKAPDAEDATFHKNINVHVKVDKTAPNLKLHLAKRSLSGKAVDGVWAVVENDDPIENRVIRAMRAFVTYGTNKKELFDTIFTASQLYNIRGEMLENLDWEGKATLVVQAYDNVAPDSAKEAVLKYSQNPDGGWNIVLKDPKNMNLTKDDFITGINGTVLVENVWFDKSAPEISSVNIDVVSADPSAKRVDGSALKKAASSVVLNAQDTLKMSFNLKEKLLNRNATTVKVSISFVDEATKVSKTYTDIAVFENNNENVLYEFVEPEANRLRDGLYDVVVEAKDEAGNVLKQTIASQVVVDRTAPEIFNMSSDNLAQESSANLKNVRGEVSQTMDVASNVKAVECFKQLNAAGVKSNWVAVTSQNSAQVSETQKYDFTISDLISKEEKGTWTALLMCYDAVGNSSENFDFFEIGQRSPKIEYPNNALNSRYFGKVLVRGIAPNPDLSEDRNDHTASFKLEWRKNGETSWNSTGFEYLEKEVAPNTRDLAIWDVSSLEKGKYILRLSSRACTENDAKCAWVTAEQDVEVYDDGMTTVTPVDIVVTNASLQNIDPSYEAKSGSKETMYVELTQVVDTSKWVVNVQIVASSPKDPFTTVVADEWTFNPARISPFLNEPATKMDGMNIWQDGKKWHLFWQGTAEGVCDKETKCAKPELVLRTLASAVSFDASVKTPDKDQSIVKMNALTLHGVTVPSYDNIKKWEMTDGLEIVFETDSAFAVDLTSVKESEKRIYCGGSSSKFENVVPEADGIGMVYVYPEQYRMKIEWDGLVNGVVPSDKSVVMKVLAYNKNDPSVMVSEEFSWNLEFGSPKIVLDNAQKQTMIVGLSESDAISAYAKQKLGLSFGLQGRSAYVTATVVNPKGETVKTLMENELLLAGNSTNVYELTWGGIKDDSFASSEQGTYRVDIVAKDASGNEVDRVSYSFDLVYAGKMIAADESNTTGDYPVLEIDEAAVVNDKLRFVGRADYLMKLSARAKHLKKDDRVVSYHWEFADQYGVQFPATYKRNEFSLGIRRHRSSFSATVATMIASFGLSVGKGSRGCVVKHRNVPYRIQVRKVTFYENGPDAVFKMNLDPNWLVDKVSHEVIDRIGSSPRHHHFPSYVAIKIFPESSFDDMIKGMIPGENGAYNYYGDVGPELLALVGLTKDDEEWLENADWGTSIPNVTTGNVGTWNSNWNGQVPIWKSFLNKVQYDSGKLTFLGTDNITTACDPAVMPRGVCGMEDASKETFDNIDKFNPHANIVTASIDYAEGNEYATSPKTNYSFTCTEHDGSRQNFKVEFSMKVKPEYWNNPNNWGINNYANRYVRFDNTNDNLYGSGYFEALKNSQIKEYDGNFYDPILGWIHKYDDGKMTAFEAQRFIFGCEQTNPLLFNDELGACNQDGRVPASVVRPINNMYSNAEFFWHFNTGSGNDGLQAIVQVKDAPNVMATINHTVTSSTSTTLDKGIDPTKLVFAVAPSMLAEKAVENPSGCQVSYPYAYDKIPEECSKNQYYDGFASRLHYAMNDWNDADWLEKYAVSKTNHKLLNPVEKKDVVSGNFAISDFNKNFSGSSSSSVADKRIAISSGDYYSSIGWYVSSSTSSKIPSEPSFNTNIGQGPSGNFKLVCAPSSWNCKKEDGKWRMTNAGDEITSEPRYVLSKTPANEMKVSEDQSHFVTLKQVVDQNKKDAILGDLEWSQELAFDKTELYSRKDTTKLHSYLGVNYAANDGRFNVGRTGNAPTERVDEIATFRGRVPGAGTKWSIQYTKDGALYPMASGEQAEVPRTTPYPVLSYFDMNHLQGNTSFFLTYGGTNGSLFFKQLDVHVGNELNPTDEKTVQSMYGNLSVYFAPGAWGNTSVDVTVRSVDPTEYLYTTFKNLKVAGPVVEVLPSHKFEKYEQYPTVVVTLSNKDVANKHFDLKNLKIYKPNFETNEIEPLEQVEKIFVDANGDPVDEKIVDDDNWAYVTLKARTHSFSSFVVTDAASIAALPTGGVVDESHFACVADVPMATLWAGTANGWLEYPYPCEGKSNYMLQLRVGSEIAAEHQAASSNPIVWKVRNSDIRVAADAYSSKIKFNGVDGSVVQKAGPSVRIDPSAPVIENADVEIVEDGNKRVLQVTADLMDEGSGVEKTTVEFYFGGSLLNSQVVSGGDVLNASYVLDRKALYSCVGCQATVKIIAEDYGHNYAKETVVSDKLFPYPASLVLWYPMQEGFGKVANEALGTGLDLNVGSLVQPWYFGNKLYFYDAQKDAATTSKTLYAKESATAFSVEMKVKRQKQSGNIIVWQGGDGWSIGISTNSRYYASYGGSKVEFPVASTVNSDAHLVWVFEGNGITMYKNGTRAAYKDISTTVAWNGAGRPSFGKNSLTNAARVALADVRIYGAALNADQVKSLYEDKLDINEGEFYVVRATDLDDREGLVKDQSCGVAGRSYLRQKDVVSSEGVLRWNVDAKADNYQLFMLMRNYVDEDSRVEVLVNGKSAGYAKFNSTGLWESQGADNVTITLNSGINEVALRPVGDVSIAAIALVSEKIGLEASDVNYGAEGWKNPDPRVAVEMHYNSGDGKIAYPNFKIRNLTGTAIEDIRLRYYYSGEGENVQAVSYYPYMFMSIVPDAGSVYYAEMTLDQPLSAYDRAYGGNGPQLGLNRVPNATYWDIMDDPSYVDGSERDYVKATGVALLDANGDVLNDWACFDEDGVTSKPKKEVRALVSDEKFGANDASVIKVVVENTGKAVVDGFEARYYFRDASGNVVMDEFEHDGATLSMVSVGGGLYYVSVKYATTILNPGESTAYSNGAKFELHYPDYGAGFDVSDDPSYYGVAGREMMVADSVLVLDANGNLLWGNAPKPKFSKDYVIAEGHSDMVHREGEELFVDIDVEGLYTLETVNAAGVPLQVLHNGTWSIGEHVVSLAGKKVSAGNYVVLRLGNKILSWQLLK